MGILGGALWCASARALAPGSSHNQYQDIPERNLFGLRPLQTVASPTQEAAPPPKLILTGITTILGNKRVLLKAAMPGAKPGEQGKEESYVLAEGQREGDIEVLQIDELSGSVKVNDFGTIVTLTFEKNGVKPPAGPGPAPNAPGTPPPSGAAPVPAFRAGLRSLPTRTPRMPAMGTAPPAPDAAMAPNPAAGPLPPTGVSSTGLPPAASAGTQSEAAVNEADLLLMELQKAATAESRNAGAGPEAAPPQNYLPRPVPLMPQ